MDHKRLFSLKSKNFFLSSNTENQLKKCTLKGNGSATVVVQSSQETTIVILYYSAYYTTVVRAVCAATLAVEKQTLSGESRF